MTFIGRFAFSSLGQYSLVWAHEVGNPYTTLVKFQQFILKLHSTLVRVDTLSSGLSFSRVSVVVQCP